MQSDADEAFARQLQEEMDALEVQHPNHKCPLLTLWRCHRSQLTTSPRRPKKQLR